MEQRQSVGCEGVMLYNGWYPKLFYRTFYWGGPDFDTTYGSAANDSIIADVHTDVPGNSSDGPLDDGTGADPGSVLHEATGRPNLLLLAIDSGGDRFLCAGPVFSHYELEVIGAPRRLSDDEWSGMEVQPDQVPDFSLPADVPASRIQGLHPPIWTKSFLIPDPSRRGGP